MHLTAGDKFGRYHIVSPLGSGGMGEVYRASDPQLARDVAIKVISPDASRSADDVRRFQNEARVISQLNHPSIVVVYDMGLEPQPYIAMELVDGMSLRQTFEGGALPVKRAVELASQIADGLARAHEADVVHRDLKPENIMVSRDGHAKILDFGLAKLRLPPLEDASQAMTLPGSFTKPGAILGTVGYMAPEQARGEDADFSTDQFAFGAILYEMLTGVRAFHGGSAIETLSAILREEPTPLSDLNPRVPAPLRWIVERCLQKARRDRYTSTRDLARELANLREHFAELSTSLRSTGRFRPAAVARRRGRLRRAIRLGAAGALAAAALAAGFLLAPSKPPEFVFQRLTARRGHVSAARFSPDGETVAIGGDWEETPAGGVFTLLRESPGSTRQIAEGRALPMAFGAGGSDLLVVSNIRKGGFLPTGTLEWVPAMGGDTRPFLAHVAWADWSPQRRKIAVILDDDRQRTLALVDAEGRDPRVLDRTPGVFSSVRFSPDGAWLAYIFHPSVHDEAGDVRLVSLDGSAPRTLTPLYGSCRGLAWNPARAEVWYTAASGGAQSLWSVTRKGRVRRIYATPSDMLLFDISPRDGTLLVGSEHYRTELMIAREDAPPRELSWSNRSEVCSLSRDGRRLLFVEAGVVSGEKTVLWIRPIDGGAAQRLGPGDYASFSPDESWVVGTTPESDGPPQIIVFPTGVGAIRAVTHGPGAFPRAVFSADGSYLIAEHQSGDTPVSVWKVSLQGALERRLSPDGCSNPVPSPDGRWIACACDFFRNVTIFPAAGGPPRVLYTASGQTRTLPLQWSASSNAVYAFENPESRIVQVDLAGSGPPREIQSLLAGGFTDYRYAFSAAVTPDGTVRAWTVGENPDDLYVASRLR
jgi:WD40 repeat protein